MFARGKDLVLRLKPSAFNGHNTFLRAGAETSRISAISTTSPLMSCHAPARRKHTPMVVERSVQRRSLASSIVAKPSKALINDIPNQEILIELDSGEAARYPSFWLRDHCLCDVCSHPSTHQRQHDTFALDPFIRATSVESTTHGLEVTWADTNSHRSTFPWTWLAEHSPFPTSTINGAARHQASRPWTPFTSSSAKPQTPFPTLTTPEGQHSLFTNIHTHGLAFLPQTPPTPTATIQILNTLGPIRHTHYGGFWDFTSEANPIDTAYTNLGLPCHTDNTYFTDPAGLQLFHLLSHVPVSHRDPPQPGDFDPSLGGENPFVDGFAAADALYRTDPTSYHVLSTQPIVFAAEGSPAGAFRNNHLHSTGNPVFQHAHPTQPGTSFSPATLTQVRWNNCDRSPLTTFASHAAMLQWYKAARLWEEILQSREFEVVCKLVPGEPVVFDNWRMLHGRKAFEGKRRMCGAYIGMDDFRAGLGRVGAL